MGATQERLRYERCIKHVTWDACCLKLFFSSFFFMWSSQNFLGLTPQSCKEASDKGEYFIYVCVVCVEDEKSVRIFGCCKVLKLRKGTN